MAIKSEASQELDSNLTSSSNVFVDGHNDANNNEVVNLGDATAGESSITSAASSQEYTTTSTADGVPTQAPSCVTTKVINSPSTTPVTTSTAATAAILLAASNTSTSCPLITANGSVTHVQTISASPVHSTGSGMQSHSGSNTDGQLSCTIEYLAQLMKDTKQLQTLPNVFIHVERLLEEGTCSNFFFRLGSPATPSSQ